MRCSATSLEICFLFPILIGNAFCMMGQFALGNSLQLYTRTDAGVPKNDLVQETETVVLHSILGELSMWLHMSLNEDFE